MSGQRRRSATPVVTMVAAGLLAVFDLYIWASPDPGAEMFDVIASIIVVLLVLSAIRQDS